jgi:hypothetical protein
MRVAERHEEQRDESALPEEFCLHLAGDVMVAGGTRHHQIADDSRGRNR